VQCAVVNVVTPLLSSRSSSRSPNDLVALLSILDGSLGRHYGKATAPSKEVAMRRPSPALVVACIALGVALGGTSYATVMNVPKSSVGTPQLKRNAVKAAKIAPNAVRTGHVLDGSLLAADFKAGQIPQGPKGDKGDKGDNGISRVLTNRTSGPTHALTATSAPILSLELQAGRYLIIGKVWVSGSQSNFTAICTTGVGPTGDLGLAGAYNGTAGVAVSDTITMQALVELSAAGTATISCWTPRAASWGEATLSAIQVG
jgi:hypothetical protein